MSTPLLPPAIILVDDDEDVRVLLKRLLSYFAEGYELVALDTAAAALAALGAYQVPLLITDYNMPRMNGITLTKVVKARSPQTKVLLITAYATPELARVASAVGAEYYLPKPFPFDKLEAIVKAALSQ